MVAAQPLGFGGQAPPAPSEPEAPAGNPGTRKLKLNNVVDQCLDGEVVNMSPAATRRLFDKYEAQRGAQPHPEHLIQSH